jgi:hypothetical protein
MSTRPFDKGSAIRRPTRRVPLQDITLRDFSGGLQLVDSETVLSPKYSSALCNMFVHEQFGHINRFGTRQYAELAANVVRMVYYVDRIVAVLADGRIQTVDDTGSVTTIWDTTIAAALPGSPTAWGTTTEADFTEFNGSLILTNGTDKPVIVSQTFVVQYLQDLGTGSNINTPICKYITTAGEYVVMARVASTQDIYISSKQTSGTWIGDPAPNDSTSINLGQYVSSGSRKIRGVFSFRNRLIVFFEQTMLIVILGEYDADGNHVPRVADSVARTGLVGAASVSATKRDMIFMSAQGVLSAKAALFTESFDLSTLSENIQSAISLLLPETQINFSKCFAVTDWIKNKMFFFLHTDTGSVNCYCMSFNRDLKKISWTKITGWDFVCGCSTEQHRVFFGKDNIIWQYGNDTFEGEEYYADFITDADPDGTAVDVEWELPWQDLGKRVRKKKMHRIVADTQGTAPFQIEFYIDRQEFNGLGERTPALSMNFEAGATGGYGTPTVGYGGGRRISDERYYGMPLDFKVLKMRITGSVTQRLLVTSVSILYSTGGYFR